MTAAPLPAEDANVVVIPMLTPSRALGYFLGDLQRRSRSKSGRTAASYERLLDKFCTQLERRGDIDVAEITPDDCRQFLNGYARRSPGYQATIYATLNSFLRWLYLNQRIKRNPLDFVPRPRRIPAEDLDVPTVSTQDVPRLLAGCETWPERIALAILAYLGPRRNAVALLRLSDYDPMRRRMRFREKGGKVIWKPVPDELADILDAAIAAGVYHDTHAAMRQRAGESRGEPGRLYPGTFDPYLVPPEGPLARIGDRDDRCIWRIVRRVADGVGVPATVHALRAAFAVFYLETHDGDIVGLQELMGHASLETTRIYLRKLDKQRAMEPVRRLSWAGVGSGNLVEALTSQIAVNAYASSPVVGAGGFEPPNVVTPSNHAGWTHTEAESGDEDRPRSSLRRPRP